jgi:hypothetical protein
LRSRRLAAAAGWERGRRFQAGLARRPVKEQRALGEHELDVLADGHLDRRVVPPVRDRVAPGLDPKVPQPFARRDDIGAVAVGPLGELAHISQRAVLAGRVPERDSSPEPLVSFAEHGGADRHGLPGDRLGRPPPVVHHRLNVENRNPADHQHEATLGAVEASSQTPPGQTARGMVQVAQRKH